MQEERDHQFGRLFGAEVIIKSEILFHSSTGFEAWSDILDIIYDLAKKKSWLREECGFILFDSISVLKSKDIKYAQTVINKLLANGLSKTPQGIAIWIGIRTAFSSTDLPHGVWHNEDPLNRKESSKLIQILIEAPIANSPQDGAESGNTGKSPWSTKLPFVWEVILDEVLDIQPRSPWKNTKSAKKVKFAEFWEKCIDRKLVYA